MKILLIHTPVLQIDNFVPPLGILYLAAVLKKEGCEVKVIDKDPDFFDFISNIKNFNPDAIGLSFMTPSYGKAKRLCKILKERFPGVILFSGGIHTSVLPKQILKELNLDFVVVGEAEKTIVEVYDRLKDKKSLISVKGVIFRDDKKFVDNGPRKLIEDLDKIPFPDRSLLNFKKDYLVYPGMIRGHACKSTTIISSRGCPYNCTYCSSKLLFGKKVRYRSVDNLVAEIKYLINEYGIEGIWFADDTFTINPDRVIEFCKAIKKENIKLAWACQVRVNTVSDDLLKEMKSAGCVQLDFGVESGSDKILKILKKGTNINMIKDAFELAKKNKIRTLATFMVNNPFETKEDLDKTFKLAKEISADFTIFFYNTPFPGTEIYNAAVKNGWLNGSGEYSDEWNIRAAELPVMNATGLTKNEIMKIRNKMQNHFFIKNYIRPVNFVLTLKLVYQALISPKISFGAFKEVIKTGKLDRGLEVMFAKLKKIS